MNFLKKNGMILSGLLIGAIGSLLVVLGNPANMGFCIACFIRDTAGALGFHQAAAVQYLRPEIPGLILGSFLAAYCTKEFRAKGGSSPVTRFILGVFTSVGALMFLGCPLRMVLRLAGGDLNALCGLLGFVIGIACGIFFLKKGYSLKRTYTLSKAEGMAMPAIQIFILILIATAPSFIKATEPGGGPGAKFAPVLVSLLAGLIVGIVAQRSRICMVGGIRDIMLYKDTNLIKGFLGIFIACFVCNLIFGKFTLGFAGQPIAHNDAVWNCLGMVLTGFAGALLGGCPLRQLILSGEGNSDSTVTVLGLFTGAAVAHNFGLASSAAGPTAAGKVAVIIGIVVTACIGCIYTFKKEERGV